MTPNDGEELLKFVQRFREEASDVTVIDEISIAQAFKGALRNDNKSCFRNL